MLITCKFFRSPIRPDRRQHDITESLRFKLNHSTLLDRGFAVIQEWRRRASSVSPRMIVDHWIESIRLNLDNYLDGNTNVSISKRSCRLKVLYRVKRAIILGWREHLELCLPSALTEPRGSQAKLTFLLIGRVWFTLLETLIERNQLLLQIILIRCQHTHTSQDAEFLKASNCRLD